MSGTGPGHREAADGDYEYRDLIVEAWDVFRADAGSWPDVAFYRSLIQASGQPVLDVGCATGRLVLAYLEEGMDTDGVDVSPEMLAILRRKAAERGVDVSGRLFQQHMATLTLPRRYRTIVVSSSTFQLLTEQSAATEALRRLYAHLEPGGTLVMSLMLLWKDEPPAQRFTTEWSDWRQAVRASDGAIFRRRSRATFDMMQQLVGSAIAARRCGIAARTIMTARVARLDWEDVHLERGTMRPRVEEAPRVELAAVLSEQLGAGWT